MQYAPQRLTPPTAASRSAGPAGTCHWSGSSTPLLHCAEQGSPEVAGTLKRFGSDVNEQDDTGATALTIAARMGHLRLVRWLLVRSLSRSHGLSQLYGLLAHSSPTHDHVRT